MTLHEKASLKVPVLSAEQKHIPDKNIYLEIKNAVEQSGGYIETQLNSNLLQIKPAFFIDLMLAVCEESEKENYRFNNFKVCSDSGRPNERFSSKCTKGSYAEI